MAIDKKFLDYIGLKKYDEKIKNYVDISAGILGIKKNGVDLDIDSDKKVNITVPTKVSELTNDSGFKTTDNNTTYSLSKSGSTITLTGSDGSSTSVTDSNTTYGVASSSTLGLVKSGTDITVDSNGNVSVNNNSHSHTVSNISDLTATASELNVLDGITVTTEELNYVDGVTSNIQTQLNSKSANGHTHDDRYYTKSEIEQTINKYHGYSGVGSGSTAADAKAYFKDESKVPNGTVKTVYESAGDEYTLIFSKSESGACGTILKWGYKDSNIRILRFRNRSWLTEDWEAVSTELISDGSATFTASDISNNFTNLNNTKQDAATAVKKRENGYSYTQLGSYYSGGYNPNYIRIAIPKKDSTWTMCTLEITVKQSYLSALFGKILVHGNWSSGDEWNNLYVTVHGRLSNNIKVYGSDKTYIYIDGCEPWCTLTVDKMLIGDNATNYDLSDVTIDSVESLPEVYQTAEMIYDINTENIGSQSLPRLGWWSSDDTSKNADDLVNGYVFAYGTHNAPDTGTLVAFNNGKNTDYILQIMGGYATNRLWYRNRNGDTNNWLPWKRILTTNDTVNELTSDSIDAPLSAAQGKVLKELVDGKAASDHTHSYLPLSGGTMTGDIKLNTDSSNLATRVGNAVYGIAFVDDIGVRIGDISNYSDSELSSFNRDTDRANDGTTYFINDVQFHESASFYSSLSFYRKNIMHYLNYVETKTISGSNIKSGTLIAYKYGLIVYFVFNGVIFNVVSGTVASSGYSLQNTIFGTHLDSWSGGTPFAYVDTYGTISVANVNTSTQYWGVLTAVISD